MARVWILSFCFYSLIIAGDGARRTEYKTITKQVTTPSWETTSPTTGWTTTTGWETTTEGDVWQRRNLNNQMFSVMSAGSVRFRSAPFPNITALTVCLRGMTEQNWMINDGLSLTFQGSSYDVVTLGDYYSDQYHLQIGGDQVLFNSYSMVSVYGQRLPWKSRCFTWDSSSGMAQLWFDGKMSVRKGVGRGTVFSGQVELSLLEFTGQVSDIYVWDSALDDKHLYYYLVHNYISSRGLILDWRKIEYSTRGYVVLEPGYTNLHCSDPDKPNKQQRKKNRRQHRCVPERVTSLNQTGGKAFTLHPAVGSCRSERTWCRVMARLQLFLFCFSLLNSLSEGESEDVWHTRDLGGRMLSVMPTGSVRFRLVPLSNLKGLTLCMKGLTEKRWLLDDKLEIKFNGSRFPSIELPGSVNPYYYLRVGSSSVKFGVNSFVQFCNVPSLWKTRCFTWESNTGMAQLIFDGKMSVRKQVGKGQVFSGPAELSLPNFEGQISDIYLWGSILNLRDICQFISNTTSPMFSNVLDWRQIEYTTRGDVVLELAFPKLTWF
ncbi:uncharacterized protein LOC134333830 [Trichomycterus rosablanca]|uniref:uncharacterized protein LOC134333830 n=1 Tax=Trichomycterus rosablanca TaxID=2290929 RepID=UPI002F354EA5